MIKLINISVTLLISSLLSIFSKLILIPHTVLTARIMINYLNPCPDCCWKKCICDKMVEMFSENFVGNNIVTKRKYTFDICWKYIEKFYKHFVSANKVLLEFWHLRVTSIFGTLTLILNILNLKKNVVYYINILTDLNSILNTELGIFFLVF